MSRMRSRPKTSYKALTDKEINISQDRSDLIGEFIEDEDELATTFPLLFEVFMEEFDPDLEPEEPEEEEDY